MKQANLPIDFCTTVSLDLVDECRTLVSTQRTGFFLHWLFKKKQKDKNDIAQCFSVEFSKNNAFYGFFVSSLNDDQLNSDVKGQVRGARSGECCCSQKRSASFQLFLCIILGTTLEHQKRSLVNAEKTGCPNARKVPFTHRRN